MLSLSTLSMSAVADNPFLNPNGYFLQPDFQTQVQSSITGCQGVTECRNLQTMKNTSTAFWVDKMSKIADLGKALATAAAASPPQLFVTVLYDLPNRDCDAFNSVGEICCYTNPDGSCDRAKDGDCAAGLQTYYQNFSDPIAALFKQYEGKLPIVAIIEPDSLPNLATNLGNPNCANMATSSAYNNGVPYLIKNINANAPSVTMCTPPALSSPRRPPPSLLHLPHAPWPPRHLSEHAAAPRRRHRRRARRLARLGGQRAGVRDASQ